MTHSPHLGKHGATVATTQQAVTSRPYHTDRAGLAATYLRWFQSDSGSRNRPERILAEHLRLAEFRAHATANVRVYLPGDEHGLGAAVHIVNDDMPLLVDTVTAALRWLGVEVAEVVHPICQVVRDRTGRLCTIEPGNGAMPAQVTGRHVFAESWMHIQLSSEISSELAAGIEQTLRTLLVDLRRVTEDTPRMSAATLALADRLNLAAEWAADAELPDCADLLRWLADGHFTILGYGEYQNRRSGPAIDAEFEPWLVPGTGLGLLRDGSETALPIPVSGAPRPVLRLANGTAAGFVPGVPDLYFVSVADLGTVDPGRAGATGDTTALLQGEHVFVGTFTVTALHEDVLDIPVVAGRVQQAIEWAGFDLRSFSGQTMLEVLQAFPRRELFSSDARRLLETVSAVMNLGARRQVRLFVRQDERAVYCLVYLPRDRYSTESRNRMRDILFAEFGGERISYSARATESELAVVYFTVYRSPQAAPVVLAEVDRERVQEELFAATRTWPDRVMFAAAGSSTELRAAVRDYADAFPAGYQEQFGPEAALRDVRRLEGLAEGAIGTRLYRRAGARPGEWRFTLYKAGHGVSLSELLPLLHSLGLEVVDEQSYPVSPRAAEPRWIYDFGLRVPAALLRDSLDPDMEAALDGPGEPDSAGDIRRRLPDAVTAMWSGRAEADGLNELVLRAGMRWRHIVMLRAYARYLRQAGFAYGLSGITRVLLAHPAAARLYAELFDARFDPDHPRPEGVAPADEIAARLQQMIDAVPGLDADRVLRAFLGLIQATLRTNYFRRGAGGAAPDYLSLKFDPASIAELPWPRPRFEIFVYSPRFEGVHLRFGPVARGGLRWSDRLDDFRTEILGLVKAQAVKNAVIVPVGAKGGFVVKKPPAADGVPDADRQALLAEGVRCYRTFICGLLDLTDNVDRATGAVLPPDLVVRHDDADTYLVVAADKGTAAFSDIANDVAAQYDYWLGDAFASGGSVGYDHKIMGITARGAWVSVRRHFGELDIDIQTAEFTVAGIGDMSGDVFGNGMLLSRTIRLVAAFDHRHIFLDPYPDPEDSYAERERLFRLSRSSWADYDRALLSDGGGVYDRTAKSVPIGPEVRLALGLDDDIQALSPPELIQAILVAPVDLLWNGGIGTYIKASAEAHAEVGDKANDAVRVDANRVRARVIGEGGNLGVTPFGRIEFSRRGGRINTDAVDNSAGVDCSDREVNIKILLDTVAADEARTPGERGRLLAGLTDAVAELVLQDNHAQNRCLGLSRASASAMVSVHRRLLCELEQRGVVDRERDALPADAELARRTTGLSSPELATLMAQVKLSLKADLLTGSLPDSPASGAVLLRYFPGPLRDDYADAISRHPLRREIIATAAANELVDDGGISFAFRLAEEAGADAEDAVRAFGAAVRIFDLRPLWERIRQAPVPAAVRGRLELETRRTLDRVARWLLANRPQPLAIGAEVARYREGIRTLALRRQAWLPAALAANIEAEAEAEAGAAGAPADLAVDVFGLIHLYPMLDVLDIADIRDRDPGEVAQLYSALSTRFEIDRLLAAVARLDRGDRWSVLARLAIREDLGSCLRALTIGVLTATEQGEDTAEKIEYWASTNRSRIARVDAALRDILAAQTLDLAALSVAASQVRGLVSSADTEGTAPGR
ncbi:NAD-glutamate dehydrogenase [Nocardia sp. NPDC051832]|uniref:NAD-glutamate dehydrogenase n=1 Tax=Nocardia sp. NPDC051832 TaxID=3155673 RepID=UPI00342D7808